MGLWKTQPALSLAGFRVEMARRAVGEFQAWAATTRMNPGRGMQEKMRDADVAEPAERMKRFGPAAFENLTRLASTTPRTW